MRAGALSLSALAPILVVLVSLCGSSTPLPPPNYFVPVNPTEPATTYTPHNDVWRLLSPPDGETLHIAVDTDSCAILNGIDVTETNNTVTLIARDQYRRSVSSPGPFCAGVGLLTNADVTLNAPLDDRHLEGCYPSDIPQDQTSAMADCRATLR